MIFIRHPFDSNLKVLNFDDYIVGADVLRDAIGKHFGYEKFTLLHNGKTLCNTEVIPCNSTVHVALSLPGGKGGFGSMLRAIGAQIEKTTNREACRDLSGRRLRDINEEQRLKKWIAKKAEREAEKIRRRKERLERLKQKPQHKFFDYEYEKEISQLPERVDEALNEGLQKAKQTLKRQHENAGPSKPKKTWLADEFSSTSSDSDSNEISSSDNSNSAKKLKTESTESSGCYSDVSDMFQFQPSSSKTGLNFDPEENLPAKSECNSIKDKTHTDQKNENCNDSEKMEIDMIKNKDNFSPDLAVLELPSTSSGIDFSSEVSLADTSECQSTNIETDNEEKKENGNNSDKTGINLLKDEGKSNTEQTQIFKDFNQKASNQEWTDNKITEFICNRKEVCESVSLETAGAETKKPEEHSPIHLLDFQDISEIEALGLDRLKTELMSRGLKCGGSLSDRAQRLWKIRGLQPNEYPSNLLAKHKK